MKPPDFPGMANMPEHESQEVLRQQGTPSFKGAFESWIFAAACRKAQAERLASPEAALWE